jgi:hypothetical protein
VTRTLAVLIGSVRAGTLTQRDHGILTLADDVVKLDSALPGRLADRVGEHVERCRAALG